jgi:CHAT domain-containing protein
MGLQQRKSKWRTARKLFQFLFFTTILGWMTVATPAISKASNLFGQSSASDTLQTHRMAKQLLNDTQYDSALVYFRKAADTYRNQQDRALYLRAQNSIGHLLNVSGKLKEAKKILTESLNESRQLDKAHRLQVDIMNNLISVHIALDENQTAQQLIDESLQLVQRELPDEQLMLARIYHNQGSLFQETGKYDQAWEYYQKALKIREAELNPDAPLLASTYNALAIINYYRGNQYQAAEMFLDAARSVQLKKGEMHPDVAGYFNNAGIVFKELGEYEESAKYSTKALRIQQKLFGEIHPDLTYSYSNLANLHRQLEEYDKALEYQKKELAIAKQTQGPRHYDVARTYYSISKVQYKLGLYDQSLASIDDYFDIAWDTYPDGHPEMLKAYISKYEIFFHLGKWSQAEQQMHKAQRLSQQLESKERITLSNVYKGLGDVHLEQKEYDEAIEHLHKALGIIIPEYSGADMTAIPQLRREYYLPEVALILGSKALAMAYYEPIEAHQKTAFREASLRTFDLAVNTIDKIQEELHSEESKLHWGARSRSVFAKAIEACYRLHEMSDDQSYLQKAYHYAEKSRSRVIIEQINDSHAKQFAGVPDSLIQEEKQIREMLGQIKLELASASFQKDSAKVTQLQDSLYAVDDRLQSHIVMLEREFPDYHQLKYQRKVVSLEDIQESMLDPGQSLVEYFYSETHLYTFVINQSGIALVEQERNPQFKARVDGLREHIIARSTDSVKTLSGELYGTLIQPIESEIQDQDQLIIVPDGPLYYLPFEVLLTDVEDPRSYLIKRHKISYMPSATLMWQEQARKRAQVREENQSERLLAMAPLFLDAAMKAYAPEPIRSDSITPLPLTRYEVESIAKQFEDSGGFLSWIWDQPEPTIRMEREATEQFIKQGNLKDYTYLHFATHAYIKEDYPNLSGIQFYDVEDGPEDGVLLANEVYNLDINADLVVLSACETGLGEMVEGEGIIGFTRPFLYAGAANLMVSLWKVADRSTAECMIAFYERVLDGDNYAQALREAKLEMIESGQFADPWYWSPFVLIGQS